jgi:hypothetical protein
MGAGRLDRGHDREDRKEDSDDEDGDKDVKSWGRKCGRTDVWFVQECDWKKGASEWQTVEEWPGPSVTKSDGDPEPDQEEGQGSCRPSSGEQWLEPGGQLPDQLQPSRVTTTWHSSIHCN